MANAPAPRRNIGIIAHIDAGKTTLSERFLYYSGREHRMGEVDEGTATMDWMPEEQERGITITSAATTFEWNGTRITLIDTPGHVDFTAEVERSLRVLDGAVGVFSGVEGVEAQSETVWRQADRYRVPRIAFVNKLDRAGADYFRVLADVEKKLACKPLPMIVPIGSDSSFEGVIDLVRMVELRFDETRLGAALIESPIAAECADVAAEWRDRLLERVADGSEAVMEKYVSGDPVPEDLLRREIRAGTIAHRWVPTFGGAAFRNKGVQLVLDGVVHYLPAPEDIPTVTAHHPKTEDLIELKAGDTQPLVALVFKLQADSHGELFYVRIYSGRLTRGGVCVHAGSGKKERIGNLYRMHAKDREAIESAGAGDIVGVTGLRFSTTGDTLCDPTRQVLLEPPRFPETVISVAVEPRGAGERDRLLELLRRLVKEDPTLKLEESEGGQILLSGMGELHLEVKKNSLLRDFNISANFGKPRVSYRQTLARPARASARYDKIQAGKPQLGAVELEVGPDPAAAGATVEWGERGLLPKHLAPKVEEAARDRALSGGPCGFPYIQVRVRVATPAFTPDMTELGLQMAVKEAFDEAEKQADPVLLEPLMRFQIVTPDEYYGSVHQDLARRRSTIQDVTSLDGLTRIEGTVPLSEVFGYTTDLRSISQGRASISLEPVGFTPAPAAVADRFRF